jgi:hypothetical protein
MCEVLRNSSPNTGSTHEVFVETVNENNLAFGSKCPVHVKMASEDSSSSEVNGEIICPHFSQHNENGGNIVTYTVKLLTGDGGILIEKGVSSDRIRYRYGLDQLRANLKGKRGPNTMMAIRTGSLGLPIRKTRCPTYKPVFVHLPPSCSRKTNNCKREASFKDLSPRGVLPPKAIAKSTKNHHSHQTTTSSHNICKTEDCNCFKQKGCSGYCFKHYYLMLRNNQIADVAGSAGNTDSESPENREVIDLT